MKMNSITIRNYKLFRYNLLKLQIYSDKSFINTSTFSNNVLECIEAYLKQALKTIFEYHIFQFKILFVGFPIISDLKQKKLVHFTNHNFIPEKTWISGIFRNRVSILSYLHLEKFSKSLKLLFSIKAKPHLVVLMSQEIETSIINEFYKTGIPILSFNCNCLDNNKLTYKVLRDYNIIKKNLETTYFFLLYSILKKIPRKK